MERFTRPLWVVLLLLFVLLCGLCRPASAAVVYVNKNAPGTVHDGKSWGTAFTAVQPAIDAATAGDEVWVAKGAYVGLIVLKGGVPLYGGFTGAETERTQRDWKANASTLDGGGTSGDVVTCWSAGIVVDGFTIRNGYNGVYIHGSAILANNIISGNSFIGVFMTGGTATLINNTVSGNATAGVYASGVTTMVNNTLYGNRGSGVDVIGSSTIHNNTLSGNYYGIVLHEHSDAAVVNNIVAFNEYYGVYVHPGGTFRTRNHNDVYGSGIVDYYSAAAGPTDLSQDPRFVNPLAGNFHLSPGSVCVDAGDDAVVAPGDKDHDGLPRSYGAHVDIGAYEWQPPRGPWSISVGNSVTGGVTVAEKVAYIAGAGGNLYARSTEDGSAVPGFPVDITAAVGAAVKLPSRPAVYYGKTGKAIYLTTDRGDVLRILPSGQVAWHVRPLGGQTVSTPAVTPDGYVYVSLSTGDGPYNNYLLKLDETTGRPLNISPFLGYTTAGDLGDFSPAANGRYLYVNAGWGSRSGLTLLNADNLTVRSSFAAGEQCLSPLLLGNDLLLAGKGGKAWKMNAVTLAPDLGFGHFGVADVGGQITAPPFSDAAGKVYVGTADGRILKWTPGTPAFQPFTTATGRIAGLTINRVTGVLGFGTSGGQFVQVPLANPGSATMVLPGGPISTGTAYDSLTDRFIVVTDNGVLSGYPSAR